MSHEVPDTWSQAPLAELASYTNGRAFKPEDWKSSGLPIIRIANMTKEDALFNFYEGDDVDDGQLVNNGDILFSWSATLSIQKWNRGPGILNQHIFKVVPSNGVDPDWLLYVLQSEIERLAEQSHGSTMKHIKKGVLKTHVVSVPPLPEQRQIAEVLSSVDEAIAATRAVIEQTRKVKQGVLERLLTEGIGHTRFKQTDIGEIPEGWTLSRISEIASVKGGKRMPAGRPFADVRTDFPYIRVSDFKNGSVDPSNLVYVLPEDQKLIARYTISCRDVYISIAGTIGICGMVPEYLEGAQLTENAAKITVKDEEQIIPEFLALALSSDIAQRQIAAAKGVGGGVPKLALFRIEEIELPVPPAKEQAEIVQHLRAVNDAIAACELDYEHQVRMKQALMSDLLTGRKRVTSDLPLAAE